MNYFDLIAATLRTALASSVFTPPSPGCVAMTAALPTVADRLGFPISPATRLAAESHLAAAPDDARVVDGCGHTRPIYAPMFHRARGVRPVGRHGPAANVATQVFDAWALLAIDPGDRDARSVLADVISAQQPDGTFLARTSAHQLEPVWYDELSVLHALATTRVDLDGKDEAVARSVAYHVAEVQPDHASSHPFAIGAFLSDPGGVALADMMLHAAGVQQPSTMDAVSLLLLADALDCT